MARSRSEVSGYRVSLSCDLMQSAVLVNVQMLVIPHILQIPQHNFAMTAKADLPNGAIREFWACLHRGFSKTAIHLSNGNDSKVGRL